MTGEGCPPQLRSSEGGPTSSVCGSVLLASDSGALPTIRVPHFSRNNRNRWKIQRSERWDVPAVPTRRGDRENDEPRIVHFGLCIAALLVVLLPLPPSSAQSASRFTSFPLSDSPLPAPGGGLVLVNRNFDNRDPAHQLAIISRKTSRPVWSFDYGRHVLVGWSADGRSLAITDYAESDFSRVMIVRIDQHESVTVLDLSIQFEKSQLAAAELAQADHHYLEAVRWLAEDRLLLRLWGYGDGRDFSHCYQYRMGAGFSVTRASSCNPAEGAR